MHSIAFHTFLLSLLHLLVDGVCACGLMMTTCQIVSDFEAYGIIVLYDVLAFGTQPLTGRWVDTNDDNPHGLKLAMALLAGGSLISLFHVSWNFLAAMTGIILLGLGNSLFHVYGGKYVAVTSHNDIRVMGVFVSTGSVGLALGLGFSSPTLLAVFTLTLLPISILHLHYAEALTGTSSAISKEDKQTSQQPLSVIPILYLSCLMLVVAGRSFIGESVPTLRATIHSMGAPLTMVMVGVIVMTGKAAGGFLSRKWGVQNVFFASLLLSAAVFLMCPWHDAFVLITLLLINISMPCTLYLATKAVPRREGLVFGLLAMVLLPGYLLGYLSKNNVTCQALLVPLMATIFLESILLLWMHERRWQVLSARLQTRCLLWVWHIFSLPSSLLTQLARNRARY